MFLFISPFIPFFKWSFQQYGNISRKVFWPYKPFCTHILFVTTGLVQVTDFLLLLKSRIKETKNPYHLSLSSSKCIHHICSMYLLNCLYFYICQLLSLELNYILCLSPLGRKVWAVWESNPTQTFRDMASQFFLEGEIMGSDP